MMMRTIIKKLVIVLIAIVSIPQINAQISINSNDMASPGDVVIESTGLNIDFINYTQTGENFTWDFSQLIPISQTADTFISFSDVSSLYQIIFFNSSNLVKKDNNTIPIPQFPITKQYSFLNKTNTSFVDAGVGYSITGFPVPLKYNSPDLLYSFPMEYNNTWSSFADYAIGVLGIGYISKELNRTNTVDGWGTLITPYGTFEVIRLKSEIIQFDSLYLDSLGTGLPLYREYTEYSWLGNNQKIPLLQISSSLGGAIATYIDSLRSPLAVTNQYFKDNNTVSLYPNPTNDIINIEVELSNFANIAIEVYNLNGIKVFDNNSINTQNNLNYHVLSLRELGIKNGVYFIKITVNNQQYLEKIILR